MPPDEIAAAIKVATATLAQLRSTQPLAKQSARMLALLPRAVEEILTEIGEALTGNPRSVTRARLALRRLFGGNRLIS